jgi:tetratricopeptide (TPR) repeat protein
MGGEAVIRRSWGVFILILSMMACAATPNDMFSAGNVAYEQGKYAEAAALYESVVTNNVATAAAWYNLGNARFKAGQLGHAIAAWRSAERLSPRDPSLRANLAFARRKAAGGQEVSDGPFEQLLKFCTPNEWATAAAIAWLAFFVVLAISESRGRRTESRRPLVTLAVLGALTALLAGASVASYVDFYKRTEVVAVKQAAARFGPLEDSQIAFQVNDGNEFPVVDSTATWVQVEGKDGKVGWLKRDDVAYVAGVLR